MKRGTLNFVVDSLTFLVMLALVTSGLLVRFVLPPGSGERRSLWTYTRHDWGDVHFWLAVALGALVLIHVALHWGWVCSVVQSWLPRARGAAPRSSGGRNLAGAALLVAVAGLVGGLLWIAERNVVESGDGGGRQHRRGQRGALVTPAAPAGEPAALAAGSVQASGAAAGDGIRIYYFHHTLRCNTCLSIEALARAAVKEHFADELAAGRVAWQAVNIEQPANEHFERDFELKTQSLVLTEFAHGPCVRWKNLPEVWNLVENEPAFADYVRRELLEFGGG
jgi:hypothetical protein